MGKLMNNITKIAIPAVGALLLVGIGFGMVVVAMTTPRMASFSQTIVAAGSSDASVGSVKAQLETVTNQPYNVTCAVAAPLQAGSITIKVNGKVEVLTPSQLSVTLNNVPVSSNRLFFSFIAAPNLSPSPTTFQCSYVVAPDVQM